MSSSSKRSLREKGKFYKELEKFAQQQIDESLYLNEYLESCYFDEENEEDYALEVEMGLYDYDDYALEVEMGLYDYDDYYHDVIYESSYDYDDNYHDDNLYPMVGSYYKNESTNRTYLCIQAENGIGTRFINIHTGYADSVLFYELTRIN